MLTPDSQLQVLSHAPPDAVVRVTRVGASILPRDRRQGQQPVT